MVRSLPMSPDCWRTTRAGALLADAADEAGYEPDRLSRIRGLRLVRVPAKSRT